MDTPPTYESAANELLVALAHREAVQEALSDLGTLSTTVTGVEESQSLGLARLTLAEPVDGENHNLDEMLKALYAHFEKAYAGWVPTVGKNRLLGQVVDGGEVSFGGDGRPKPSVRPEGWPPPRSGPGREARVGVLDTAVSDQGPLTGWTDRYSDVISEQLPTWAVAGHGTFIAGLILSQAPGATVEVRRILNDNGRAESWDVAKAIVEFGATGLDVLNLSLVCHTRDGRPPMAIATAIDRLDPRIVVVAAAGNHGADIRIIDGIDMGRIPAYPAALESVVAVGASTAEGKAARFTPKNVPWIDILAEGQDVVSTYLEGKVQFKPDSPGSKSVVQEFQGYATWSGSSFSAALICGAIAAGMEPDQVSARTSLNCLLQRRAGDKGSGAPAETKASSPSESLNFLPLKTLKVHSKTNSAAGSHPGASDALSAPPEPPAPAPISKEIDATPTDSNMGVSADGSSSVTYTTPSKAQR